MKRTGIVLVGLLFGANCGEEAGKKSVVDAAGGKSDVAVARDTAPPDAAVIVDTSVAVDKAASPDIQPDAARPDKPAFTPADTAPPVMLDPGTVIGRQTGGTRIKTTWYKSEGGAGVFASWYDSTLLTPCSPTTLEDGKVHCTPPADITGELFSDDKCTLPVYAWAKTACNARTYVMHVVPKTCPTGYTVFRRKTKLTAVMNYQKDAAGVCKAATAFMATDDIYELEPMAATQFAQVDLKPGTETNGLIPVTRTTADGAEELAGWQDPKTGGSCKFTTAGDSKMRCLPDVVGYANSQYFSEDTCKTVVASVAATTCEVPKYAVKQGFRNCVSRTLVNKLGDKVTAGFTKDNFGCTANADTTVTLYKVGEEVKPDAFVAAAGAGVIAGDSRLGFDAFATPAGTSISGFFDKKENVPCAAGVAGDGTLRCLPTGIGLSNRFSDSDCKKHVIYTPTCGAYLGYTTDTTMCPARNRIYRLGEAYVGESWIMSGAVCIPGPMGLFSPLETEIPPADLPLLTLTGPGDVPLPDGGVSDAAAADAGDDAATPDSGSEDAGELDAQTD